MTQLELDFDEPPTSTFKWNTENYDYSKFYLNPTANLSIGTIKPNYNMCFHKDNKEVGKLDWNGSEMVFSGDLAPSARVFFDYLTGCFQQRLQQEYDNGYQDGQIKTSL
jgi:hypothetical protein